MKGEAHYHKYHGYIVGAACVVGFIPAVLLNHFWYWTDENAENERNFFDGHYWVYNSVTALQKLFPEFTPKQVRTGIEKLVEDGYLISGVYNKSPMDRTKWYTLSDKGRELLNGSNLGKCICPTGQLRFAPQGRPIPIDNNKETYITPSISNDIPSPPSKDAVPYQHVQELYNKTCPSLPRCQALSDKRRTAIKVCFRDFGLEKIEEAFKLAEQSDFLKGVNNDRNWNANFDWLMNKNNMLKVLEGNYANKESSSGYGHKKVCSDYDPNANQWEAEKVDWD